MNRFKLQVIIKYWYFCAEGPRYDQLCKKGFRPNSRHNPIYSININSLSLLLVLNVLSMPYEILIYFFSQPR